MLFLYAICFSYSFMNLYAGIGTLILFAVVQLSMILIALFYKEKLSLHKIIGVLIAFAGLGYLLYPKEEFVISLFHASLMIIAGIAWGVYSVLGKNLQMPLSIQQIIFSKLRFLHSFLEFYL